MTCWRSEEKQSARKRHGALFDQHGNNLGDERRAETEAFRQKLVLRLAEGDFHAAGAGFDDVTGRRPDDDEHKQDDGHGDQFRQKGGICTLAF